jgi:hypothetical protein
MTTSLAASGPAAAGQHLAAIAASLSAGGFTSRLTQTCGTPVLTVAAPGAGPEPDTVCLHPDPYAGPGPALQFDCTCIWTPAPGASPQATAATIAAVLTALRPRST